MDFQWVSTSVNLGIGTKQGGLIWLGQHGGGEEKAQFSLFIHTFF
ncbi:hypothetical protein [Brevibacillus formosus]